MMRIRSELERERVLAEVASNLNATDNKRWWPKLEPVFTKRTILLLICKIGHCNPELEKLCRSAKQPKKGLGVPLKAPNQWQQSES